LTAYGELLPVATMLEKLGFQQWVEETLTVKRQTRSMPTANASSSISRRAGERAAGS
jgi:hypothetical protein